MDFKQLSEAHKKSKYKQGAVATFRHHDVTEKAGFRMRSGKIKSFDDQYLDVDIPGEGVYKVLHKNVTTVK